MPRPSFPIPPSFYLIRRQFLLAGLALVAACADRVPSLPDPAAAPIPPGSFARLECRATVAAREVRCAEAGGSGPARNLILGGQGERVRVASSGTIYDGDSIFASAVTVQNLLSQEMGTADGTTVYGVNVFFASAPSVTDGTGLVQVANADGTGTFTAAGQPYFHYHEILAPRGISRPATWRFHVPPTVHAFAFTLLVETQVPVEEGVLRWDRVQGSAGGFNFLLDVWGSSPENVWAVGQWGALVHWQGSRWSRASSPTGATLNAVWGADAYNVVAAGDGSTILRYDGNRWTLVGSGYGSLHDVWAASPESFFAVGTGGNGWVIMHSADGGASWTTQLGFSAFGAASRAGPASSVRGIPGKRFSTADPELTDLFAVWGLSSQDVFAGGYRIADPNGDGYDPTDPLDGVILHTADGGAHWAETEFPDSIVSTIRGIWGTSSDDMYAVGYRWNPNTSREEGVILHSTDHAATWTSAVFPSPSSHIEFTSMWGRSADDVYVFGAQSSGPAFVGLVLHSTDHGATWSPVPGAPSTATVNAWGWPGGSIFVAAGAVWRFDGTTWLEDDTPPASITWRGVWSPGPDQVVAVGSGIPRSRDVPLIATSADGGATWTTTSIEGVVDGNLAAVAALSPTTLLAAGSKPGAPLLIRSVDGGASWTELALPPTGVSAVARALWASPGGELWLAGYRFATAGGTQEAMVFRSSDAGSSWNAVAVPPSGEARSITGITGCAGGEMLAVGTSGARGLILRSLDGGVTWSETLAGTDTTGLKGVVCTASGRYAVGERVDSATHRHWGVILRSVDGIAWTVDYTATTSDPSNTGIGYYAIWAAENGDLYVAGTWGTLLHRFAAGWAPMESGVHSSLYAVSGSSPRSVWVVGADGAVLRGVR